MPTELPELPPPTCPRCLDHPAMELEKMIRTMSDHLLTETWVCRVCYKRHYEHVYEAHLPKAKEPVQEPTYKGNTSTVCAHCQQAPPEPGGYLCKPCASAFEFMGGQVN